MFFNVQDSWFEVALICTTLVNSIPDDMSAVMERILTVFFSDDSHNLNAAGVNLELADGAHVVIFADVAFTIADEAALHAIYGCKGSSGLKPCLCCVNVYNGNTTRQVVERDRSRTAVYHTCTDISKFKFVTPAVLDAILRRLTAASKSERDALETDLGWKHLPRGIMYNPGSRARMCPSDRVNYDWAHILFANCIFNGHAGMLLHKLRQLGVKLATLESYVKSFKWPRSTSDSISPKDVFSESRLKTSMAAKTLKCTASEGLSLVPVLAMFCAQLCAHDDAEVRAHAYGFVLLSRVVSMIVRVVRGLTDRDALKRRTEEYGAQFIRLYGEENAPPKFHYMFHIGFYRWILNCLVHERKHKCIKKFANQLYNTSIDWDQSILREVTCGHATRLVNAPFSQFAASACLHSGRVPSKKLHASLAPIIGDFPRDAVNVSRCARVSRYEKATVRDIVSVGTAEPPILGEIMFHVSVTSGGTTQCASVLRELSIESAHAGCWKCRKLPGHIVVETQDIQTALIWGGKPSGTLTALQPLHATDSQDI